MPATLDAPDVIPASAFAPPPSAAPPDVLPASAFTAPVIDSPDVLPASAFTAGPPDAPAVLSASAFGTLPEAPQTLPPSAFDSPAITPAKPLVDDVADEQASVAQAKSLLAGMARPDESVVDAGIVRGAQIDPNNPVQRPQPIAPAPVPVLAEPIPTPEDINVDVARRFNQPATPVHPLTQQLLGVDPIEKAKLDQQRVQSQLVPIAPDQVPAPLGRPAGMNDLGAFPAPPATPEQPRTQSVVEDLKNVPHAIVSDLAGAQTGLYQWLGGAAEKLGLKTVGAHTREFWENVERARQEEAARHPIEREAISGPTAMAGGFATMAAGAATGMPGLMFGLHGAGTGYNEIRDEAMRQGMGEEDATRAAQRWAPVLGFIAGKTAKLYEGPASMQAGVGKELAGSAVGTVAQIPAEHAARSIATGKTFDETEVLKDMASNVVADLGVQGTVHGAKAVGGAVSRAIRSSEPVATPAKPSVPATPPPRAPDFIPDKTIANRDAPPAPDFIPDREIAPRDNKVGPPDVLPASEFKPPDAPVARAQESQVEARDKFDVFDEWLALNSLPDELPRAPARAAEAPDVLPASAFETTDNFTKSRENDALLDTHKASSETARAPDFIPDSSISTREPERMGDALDRAFSEREATSSRDVIADLPSDPPPTAAKGQPFTYRTDEQVMLPGVGGKLTMRHRVGYQNAEREGKPFGGTIMGVRPDGLLDVMDHTGRTMSGIHPNEIRVEPAEPARAEPRENIPNRIPKANVAQPRVTADAPETLRVEPKKFPPRDEHVAGLRYDDQRSLGDFSDAMHAEMSAEKAARLLNPRANLGVHDQVWASNHPDLALGQGDNRGVSIEFDANQLRGRLSTDKPMWKPLYDQGQGEFHIFGQPPELSKAVKRVTIDSETADPMFSRAVVSRLRQQGFERSESGSNVIYERPTARSPAVARVDAPAVEASAAPVVGKLDALESWARKRLAERQQEQARSIAKAHSNLPLERRRQRGSAGVLDPEQLVLYATIGAAKLAKGIKRSTEWAAEMLMEFPDLAKNALPQLWKAAQRFHAMDEDERALWVTSKLEVPKTETTKQAVRRTTGQVDTSKLVREVDALEGSMRAAQRGSEAGYRAGRTDAIARRRELVRIVREALPVEEQGKVLSAVAEVGGDRGMRSAIQRVREVLADHESNQAIARAEKALSKMKLDPLQGPGRAPKPVLASIPTERPVNPNTLGEAHRAEVLKLQSKSYVLTQSLRRAKSIAEKQSIVELLDENTDRVHEIVAEDRAAKETRIGDRVRQREQVVGEFVKRIDPRGEADKVNGATPNAPADAGLIRKWLGRGSLSVETIAQHFDPDKGDVHGVMIGNIRRAQEEFKGEQHRFTEHFAEALNEAGLPPHTRKLEEFISKRSTVKLPDAGDVTMTRNNMVGLVASAADPETARLIAGHFDHDGQLVRASWSFRSNPLAKAFELTPTDIAALRDQLTPGELKLIDAFKHYNRDELTRPLMQASLDLRGRAPDPHDGYFPRARNRAQNPAAGAPSGWRGQFKEAVENISSLKERAPDLKQPIFVPDFVQDVYKYVDDAARVIHLADPVRTAALVLEDPRVKAAIETKFGNSMNQRFERFLEDTAMVRTRPAKLWYEKASGLISRNISRAWLQLNPSPVAKNVFGGTVKLLPEFDVQDLLHGITKMFSPEVYKRMTDRSHVAWERYNGGLYGQYSPLSGNHVETVAELGFVEAMKGLKLGQATDALPFMEWADSVPFRAAFAAAEHFVDRTMPKASPAAKHRAVLDKFHDAVYATQNGTSSTELSDLAGLAKRNPLAQPFMMFSSDNNKSYNMLARMKGMDNATRAKTMAAIAMNAIIGSAVAYGMKAGATAAGRAISGAPDDPEELHGRRASLGWDVVKNVLSNAYGGQSIFGLVRAGFSDGQPDDASPNERLERDVLSTTVQLVKAINAYAQTADDSPDEDRRLESVKKALGKIVVSGQTAVGSPLAPLTVFIQRAMKAGGYTPPDPRDVGKKVEAGRTKALRVALPGNVQQLLAEHGRLTRFDKSKLTDAERDRLDALESIAKPYGRMQRAAKDGDAGAVAEWQRELVESAKSLGRQK